MFAALTTDQKIQLAIASITALATLIALLNVLVTKANEQRRSQPIIVAHEARSRYFGPKPSAWAVDAYLTSDGGGPAFNIRFGVEFSGIRYPHKLHVNDPDAGNIQRVMRSRERLPPEKAWPILIPSLSLWGRAAEVKDRGDLDANRIYWARYENAQGQTWETRNPGDRSARINIRRVRFPRFHEGRERRARNLAGKRDVEWEKRALAELLALRDATVHDPPEQERRGETMRDGSSGQRQQRHPERNLGGLLGALALQHAFALFAGRARHRLHGGSHSRQSLRPTPAAESRLASSYPRCPASTGRSKSR